MEVRIGVADTPKELAIELDGDDPAEIVKTIEGVIAGEESVLWLTDRDGRRFGIPAQKVAYVELLLEDDIRRVGFGKG